VAESVVVIKKLLQLGAGSDKIISQLAKLLNVINVPKARASIIWVVGEYSTKIPLLAPDIFRNLALSFPHEDSTVKLQILSMGAKLTLIPETVHPSVILIFQYICNLAKYDTNYDIRDRCRMFRGVLFSSNNAELRKNAKRLFCSSKPAPEDEIFEGILIYIANTGGS
jgi:AP-3 complex subunit beta